ncbi:MAG: SGNH/GDSL hydrolase family protein, partial [Acidobacteria bacterium]|nr:SGNH/GDSL hydrolase family protein [Acidobacteriota bacterium]
MSREDRREEANRLAEMLRSPETLRVVRRLQRTGLLSPAVIGRRRQPTAPGEVGPAPGDPHRGPLPISIWQPEERADGRTFVRPQPGLFGDHYASRREIPQAKREGCRRLCFFGESVAAGYLYAPHLTPAEILGQQLGEAWEVVDLARTNETLEGWVRTVEAARQLSPDLLVFFGGNNWNLLETPESSPYLPSVSGRQQLAATLRRGGVPSMVEAAGRQLERKVRRALDRVISVARELGIPFFLLVPEVNLADWEGRQPVHWLPGDGVARWYRWLQEGQERIGDGDGSGAEQLAR